MIKDFMSSQKAFNKNIEEKLEKLDNLVLKADSLAHDVETLKIRNTPLEAKKTEPLNVIQVQINDNLRMLAQIRARREREAEIVENSTKSEVVKICTIQPFEELKTFSTHEYPNAYKHDNVKKSGIGDVKTLGSSSPQNLESVNFSSEKIAESGLDDNMSLGETFPTIFEDDKLYFENCTLSYVIKFLRPKILMLVS